MTSWEENGDIHHPNIKHLVYSLVDRTLSFFFQSVLRIFVHGDRRLKAYIYAEQRSLLVFILNSKKCTTTNSATYILL